MWDRELLELLLAAEEDRKMDKERQEEEAARDIARRYNMWLGKKGEDERRVIQTVLETGGES